VPKAVCSILKGERYSSPEPKDGDDDQIVPYADAGPLSAKLLKNGTLKTYKSFPHGMPTTQADTINADLLAFLKA
jgi:non-heme chloroperoxidase